MILLRDRILIALHWTDLSLSDLASATATTEGSVKSAMPDNLVPGYVEWIGNPKNRASGPNLLRLTNAGRDRLSVCAVRLG